MVQGQKLEILCKLMNNGLQADLSNHFNTRYAFKKEAYFLFLFLCLMAYQPQNFDLAHGPNYGPLSEDRYHNSVVFGASN